MMLAQATNRSVPRGVLIRQLWITRNWLGVIGVIGAVGGWWAGGQVVPLYASNVVLRLGGDYLTMAESSAVVRAASLLLDRPAIQESLSSEPGAGLRPSIRVSPVDLYSFRITITADRPGNLQSMTQQAAERVIAFAQESRRAAEQTKEVETPTLSESTFESGLARSRAAFAAYSRAQQALSDVRVKIAAEHVRRSGVTVDVSGDEADRLVTLEEQRVQLEKSIRTQELALVDTIYQAGVTSSRLESEESAVRKEMETADLRWSKVPLSLGGEASAPQMIEESPRVRFAAAGALAGTGFGIVIIFGWFAIAGRRRTFGDHDIGAHPNAH